MIPLTFQSACRSAAQIGGKAFGIRRSPNRLFSSGRIKIVGSSPRNCPEVAVVRVSKNAKRCKQVTKNRVATGKSAAVTVWRHVEFMNVRFWG